MMQILNTLLVPINHPDKLVQVGLIAFGAGVGLLVLLIFIKNFLYICRPNEVLVFSGGKTKTADGRSRGYRIIHGGRAWRKPFIEQVAQLDIRTIPIELYVTQAYSIDGIPLSVRAIANIKIASDPRIIGNAIERFLGRDPSEIERVGKETLEGTLRGVLSTLTPLQVNEDRLSFAESLTNEVQDDFVKLGLQLDTLKVQHVTDDKEYLLNIGRKKVAEVIARAEIAESDANNEAKAIADTKNAEGEVAKQNADRIIVQKHNEAETKRAQFLAAIESAQRRAKAAGERAGYEAEKQLQEIRKTLEKLRLQVDVELPADAQRTAKEHLAKGNAAPIEENGRALSEALELLAKAWANAGPHAKDVYLIQQVEHLMVLIVNKLSSLKVAEVNIIDPGDGSALPNYIAGFPKTVTSVLESLKDSTGIDISGILSNGQLKGAL